MIALVKVKAWYLRRRAVFDTMQAKCGREWLMISDSGRFCQQIAAPVLRFALRTVPILTWTQPILISRLGWGEFVPGGISDG